MRAIVELPDRRENSLLRLCAELRGGRAYTLSKAKRESELSTLSDDEMSNVGSRVRAALARA